MNLTCILFGLAFVTTGLLFAAGLLHGHISAWKHMPEEEKRRVRILPLCRNIGWVISLSGVIFLLGGLWPGFLTHGFVGAMVAWLVAAGLDLLYIEKSHRYENR